MQLAKPALQVVAAHIPPPHETFEPGMLHGTPHAPQSLTLQIEVSQPLARFESQLSQP